MGIQVSFRRIKRVVSFLWLGLIAWVLIVFAMQPQAFTPEALQLRIGRYEQQAQWIYIGASILRGFFLLPSLPFMVAGIMLFPDELPFVVLVSMGSVLLSATLLYYLSDWMGFSEHLQRKYPHKMDYVRRKLEHPMSFLLVVAWSFFPLVPTDLMCYLARLVQMRYRILILGVFVGEMILMFLLIWGMV